MAVWSLGASTVELLMFHPEVWQWVGWRATTGATGPPWKEGSIPEEWQDSPRIFEMIKDYLKRYEAIDDAGKRQLFSQNKTADNASGGREALHAYLSKQLRGNWKIMRTIEQILGENERMPYDLMRLNSTKKVSKSNTLYMHINLMVCSCRL